MPRLGHFYKKRDSVLGFTGRRKNGIINTNYSIGMLFGVRVKGRNSGLYRPGE